MSEHHDTLEDLNKDRSLKEKLITAHQSIKAVFPYIARIAVAIYDPKTTLIKTYLHSSGDDNPLDHYQTKLEDAPSLKNILKKGLPRVANNMLTFENGQHEHTKRIGRHGYAASYTLPMFNNGHFFGFIFFNSFEKNVFSENILSQIDPYGHLISLMVINEMSSVQTLSAAIKTTSRITHIRDPETGSHLDRMSRYSRLIADGLANKYQLDDDYIEHVFMFSPLHDIGKIAIPDNILLKQDKLNFEEMAIMKTHARKGREMIDDLLKNFGLENFQHMNILRNIAEFHHEAVNGSGYPEGKKQADIPLEARIVAVADVFDALTSKRCYKIAWSNEQAINTMRELAGESLDRDCVEVLIQRIDEVERIQEIFRENQFG